jgi:hypothetical protein
LSHGPVSRLTGTANDRPWEASVALLRHRTMDVLAREERLESTLPLDGEGPGWGASTDGSRRTTLGAERAPS